jgi:transposase
MAKGYRPVLRDQPFLLPPDMREWLPDDHVVWLLIDAVGVLDTSALHARRRTGGAGAAGFDPDMLLVLLVWGYARGVTSSRRLEEACWHDVSFRVICGGGGVPDHVTIARFRRDFPAVIGVLFAEVLVLCARLGMGGLGVIALDGTKVRANAAMSANRSEERLGELAAAAVAAHGEADAAEDVLFGAGRRDGRVRHGGSAGGTRAERIERARAELAAERRAGEQAAGKLRREVAEAAAAGTPKPGRPPAGTEVQLARARVARAEAAHRAKIAAWQARAEAAGTLGGRGVAGMAPLPVDQCARVLRARESLARAEESARAAAAGGAGKKKPAANITDPDSRLMTAARGGFLQGYNAQNVTSSDGLIIATELTADATDTGSFEPMLRQAEAAAELITRHQPPAASPGPARDGESQNGNGGSGSNGHLIGLILADAGYLSEHNLTVAGPDRLIATGKHRDLEKAARAAAAAGPGHGDGDGDGGDVAPIEKMTARLRTEHGITAYRQRGHIAETPHGYIKHTMGFRQLALRGKQAAAAEWKLAVITSNLAKAISSGYLTRATLAQLQG